MESCQYCREVVEETTLVHHTEENVGGMCGGCIYNDKQDMRPFNFGNSYVECTCKKRDVTLKKYMKCCKNSFYNPYVNNIPEYICIYSDVGKGMIHKLFNKRTMKELYEYAVEQTLKIKKNVKKEIMIHELISKLGFKSISVYLGLKLPGEITSYVICGKPSNMNGWCEV